MKKILLNFFWILFPLVAVSQISITPIEDTILVKKNCNYIKIKTKIVLQDTSNSYVLYNLSNYGMILSIPSSIYFYPDTVVFKHMIKLFNMRNPPFYNFQTGLFSVFYDYRGGKFVPSKNSISPDQIIAIHHYNKYFRYFYIKTSLFNLIKIKKEYYPEKNIDRFKVLLDNKNTDIIFTTYIGNFIRNKGVYYLKIIYCQNDLGQKLYDLDNEIDVKYNLFFGNIQTNIITVIVE